MTPNEIDSREEHAAGSEVRPRVDALVLAVEKMPYQHPGPANEREHRPGLGVAEHRRVVVADHQEHHRQGEVVVVHAALLAAHGVPRVGPAPRLHGVHHAALPRDDHEEHVRGHDRPDRRADVDKGRPAPEGPRQLPREEGQQAEYDSRNRAVAAAERRAAQRVIDQPRGDHRRE